MSTQPTLLQINSSLFAAGGPSIGISSQLVQRYVDAWKARHADGRIVVRDLAAQPVPHLTAASFSAFVTPPEARSAEQAAVIAYSDALIDELKAADTIVLGLPMYNFGVPSWLKAYFDHVARAGVTFRYTATGAEGLLTGKKVLVFSARGGKYAGTPMDTETDYVRLFLGFLGMTDVEFVYAENLARGDEARAAGLGTAHRAIDQLAA